MLGMKENNNYRIDVTNNMEQFAIVINPPKLNFKEGYEYQARLLNEWCYEHKCIPVSYKLEGQTICAVVKRIKD